MEILCLLRIVSRATHSSQKTNIQIGEDYHHPQLEFWQNLLLVISMSIAQRIPAPLPFFITFRFGLKKSHQKRTLFGGSVPGIIVNATRWRHGTGYLGQKVSILQF